VATSGGTPYVQMAVYNQRAPIPKAVQHSVRYVDAGFQIGDEQMDRREAREGLIREIEAQRIMDPHTTVNVTMWLLAKLSELSSLGVIEKDELRRLVNEVLGGEQP